jgi:hypothetical protein
LQAFEYASFVLKEAGKGIFLRNVAHNSKIRSNFTKMANFVTKM